MRLKNHLRVALIIFLAWLGFYVFGLPTQYYTTLGSADLMNFLFVVAFSILPMIALMIILFIKEDSIKVGWWIAFYASIPLFVLDYILVGLIEGEGIGFLKTHVALSVGYLEVWIIAPLIGYALKRFQKRVERGVIIRRGEV